MHHDSSNSPAFYARLSIVASIITIALKTTAYFITGSVSLLSDAMESGVNLVAATISLIVLTVATKPADREHPLGHDKAEYFSSLIEGGMIFVAAIMIIYTAGMKLFQPQPLESLGLGLVISVAASLVNLATAQVLFIGSKKHKSITLEADGKHLMTDVWTTGGVLVGLFLVTITNWLWLDPAIAILVGINIIWTGYELVKRSILGLMDTILPEEDENLIKSILEKYKVQNINYHALYTRSASSKKFIRFHLLVPGDWTLSKSHDIAKQIEKELKGSLENSDVMIHLEPSEDPDSYHDYIEFDK